MDELDNLLLKLNLHRDTHPNLIKVWKHYVEIHKKKLECLISQGEKMLNNIEKVKDFPMETIMFIFMFLSIETDTLNKTEHENIT